MAFLTLFLIFIATTKLSAAEYCEEDDDEVYSYHGSSNGPTQWPKLFPTCNGVEQSPIDIETSNVYTNSDYQKLTFNGYNTPIKQAKVENDGHTVIFTPQDNVRRWFTVHGTDYNLMQLHFHWGSKKNPGAEHTINKRRYEMEVHFVHSSNVNRTAVLGVLVQMKYKDNKAFKPIVEVLSDVQYKDECTSLKSSLNLNNLLPENPASFYGYSGSMTTPMCTEDVAWFVLQKKQTIGNNQLNSFLKIYSVDKDDKSKECLLAPNNRPLQNQNGRTIFASP